MSSQPEGLDAGFAPATAAGAKETPEKLLDAAEHLFAELGVPATSLRMITAAAGANLAAVNYHFGSKEALVRAVILRRLEPLNRDRLALLERARANAEEGPIPLADILDALLRPPLERCADPDHRDFVRVMARLYSEPDDAKASILRDEFAEVIRRFSDAFRFALAKLPPREVQWRFQFCVGVLVHAIVNPARLLQTTGGLCDTRDVESTLAHMKSFLVAGLEAPSTPLTPRPTDSALETGRDSEPEEA